MSVSRDYLTSCSTASGYDAAALEKVIRLGELAGDITKHGFLGECLALKGGTALQLCLGPPSRLSVDLDFNYVGSASREQMLTDRPAVASRESGAASRSLTSTITLAPCSQRTKRLASKTSLIRCDPS